MDASFPQPAPELQPESFWSKNNIKGYLKSLVVFLIGASIIIVTTHMMVGRAPSDFVPGTVVTISVGSSTRAAGDALEDAHVIRYSSIFQFIVKIALADRPVIAGDFQFDQPQNVLAVAWKLTGGSFGNAQVKVTFPEGMSVNEMAKTIQKTIPSFNSDEFVAKAKVHEGYLFPDTYLVFKTIGVDALIDRLQDEYQEKIEPLRAEIKLSKRTESQIIIMASLLEKEARNAEEAKIISGILWKRYDKGMPLQVDAPFLYILGKTSSQLRATDLQKDGPYNTYTRKGLPKGPIGNPGLAMITAAMRPETSAYWYYLHDTKGVIHYAKTHDEHVANKRKYLR